MNKNETKKPNKSPTKSVKRKRIIKIIIIVGIFNKIQIKKNDVIHKN